MKNILLVLLLFSTLQSLHAKRFIKAEIEYKNGSVKSGYVGFPIGGYDKKISFRTKENSKTQKLESDKIFTITFANDGELVQLVRSYGKVYKNKKEKLSKNQFWGVLVGTCGEISLINEASSYKISKDGQFLLVYEDGHYPFIFLKKQDEKYAAAISTNYKFATIGIGIKAFFRKNASKFFHDNPELVKKIKNKEFEDIYELFAYYCSMNE